MDDVESQINEELYKYYKNRDAKPDCPIQFDYSQCTDEWIATLLNDPIISQIYDEVNVQNERLRKENAERMELQDEIELRTGWLSDVQEPAGTLTGLIGAKLRPGSAPPPPPPPSPPPSPPPPPPPPSQQQQSSFSERLKGFAQLFGSKSKPTKGWDMEKLKQPRGRQTGCPVYTQKLNFNQCDVNAIVDFLLTNTRIAQYLMTNDTKEYNALIENNALRKENEKLPGLNELKEQNRLLGFKINVAHRERGTRSPVQDPPWRMSYAGEGGIPGNGWKMSSEGGKMRRHFTCRRIARKTRRIARKTRRIARKTRHIAFKLHRKHL